MKHDGYTLHYNPGFEPEKPDIRDFKATEGLVRADSTDDEDRLLP